MVLYFAKPVRWDRLVPVGYAGTCPTTYPQPKDCEQPDRSRFISVITVGA